MSLAHIARSSIAWSLLLASCSADPDGPVQPSGDSGMSAEHADAAFDSGRPDGGSIDASRPDSSSDDAGSLPVEPTLSIDESIVDGVLHCPDSFAGTNDVVLLVHGTGANADVAWDWGYAPALADLGFDVCTVDLPSYSWEDIPLATEYVVLATRMIAARSGGSVALVGHSQGSLEIGWALTFWPSLHASVSDAIFLGGVQHGAAQAATVCGLGICRVATWQMRARSDFLAALVRDDETPGAVPYSSIASDDDTTAVPPTSVIAGGTNVTIQSVCPDRTVSHARLLSDAVAFALVVDALTHDGPVDAARLDASVCELAHVPGVSNIEASWQETRGGALFATTYLGGPEPSSEPALPAYALTP